MKIQLFVLFTLLLSSAAFASTEGKLIHAVAPSRDGPNLTAGTYKQSIDHTGLLAGQTFDQRYWVDSEFASDPKTAPVIYHICGEGAADEGYFLNDNAVEWAKTLGANLVYLEHRYYGKSIPFGDLSNDHMQYLTLNNEMEDLATFQKWVAQAKGWNGKWVSVGGSYSGTISALYRQLHPELIVGALASSAPMISGVGSYQDSAFGEDLSSTTPADGGRQWAYQGCTTFGFWEAQGMSLYIPSSAMCKDLFGNSAPYADSTIYNQKYNAPFLTDSANAPSNILFTYGSDDVWTKLGLVQQTNNNPKIVIKTIEGAGHHFDLNLPTDDDTDAVKAARDVFIAQAKTWLK